MKNKRIAITLTENQLAMLTMLSEITSKSKTKIINKAIELYYDSIVNSLVGKNNDKTI